MYVVEGEVTYAGEKGGESDGDAASWSVKEDEVCEDAFGAEEGSEGDVEEAVGEGIECREGGGEVGLVDVASAGDVEEGELLEG